MLTYQRPSRPELVFRDENGAVIPYGRRWADQNGDGPDDTYSITVHPERFAPIVEVAGAILEHLVATYDVSREDLREPDGGTRVRLIPSDTTAAPLEFTFGPLAGVRVTAGISTDIAWFCTCDHCDEDVDVVIEGLEQEISAVIEGGLKEWLNDPGRGYVGDDLFMAHELRSTDGGDLCSGGSGDVREQERDGLRAQFRDVPSQWAAWPRRGC